MGSLGRGIRKGKNRSHVGREQSNQSQKLPNGTIESSAADNQEEAPANFLWLFLRKCTIDAQTIIAFGTILLGLIAIISLKETSTQFKVSERPWIGTSQEIPIDFPNTNDLARVAVQYVNGGKTPALSVSSFFRLCVGNPVPTSEEAAINLKPPGPPDECSNMASRDSGAIAIPGVDHGSMVTPDAEVFRQWQEIQNNKVGMYLTGCINYKDAFGDWHQTLICKYWAQHTKGIFHRM